VTHVALVFPGMSYGHASPALRYVALALEQTGAVVERITYPVVDEHRGQQPFWTPEREARFAADVLTATRRALVREPDRVTLVGKSLGTHALASLVDEVALPAHTDAVWLTPVFGEDAVFEAARRCRWRSLHVVGLADSVHVPERQAQVPGAVLELPGADHVLEVDGDVMASIAALALLTERVLDFVAGRD
jgi:hypothetical protein